MKRYKKMQKNNFGNLQTNCMKILALNYSFADSS